MYHYLGDGALLQLPKVQEKMSCSYQQALCAAFTSASYRLYLPFVKQLP